MSRKNHETLNNRKSMFLTPNFFTLCFSITARPVPANTYMLANTNDRGFCPFETKNGHSLMANDKGQGQNGDCLPTKEIPSNETPIANL